MINYLSQSIAYFFIKKNIIPREEIDSYIYGFQIILISSINWGIILLIMLATGKIPETLLYMTSVILLRHHTGGYHASTHVKCSLLSISAYVLVLMAIYFFNFSVARTVSITLILVSLAVIFKYAPMMHENNPVKEYSLYKHKQYSRILLLIIVALLTILLLIRKDSLALSLSLGTFQVCIFLWLEKMKNKRRCHSYEVK